MVKRYYIQDYPENFRGHTETRTIASDFIRPSIESSLTRREIIRHVVRAGGFLQVLYLNRVRKLQCRYQKKYMKLLMFSILYDEVFMLFLLPALSYTHYAHHSAHHQKRTKLGS